MKYRTPCAWILLGMALSVPQTPNHAPVFSNDAFRLLINRKNFALQFKSNGKKRQIAIPREWLVPPQEEQEEIGNYVLSFSYDPPITSFAVGNGLVGLHLSSYDLTREGTSHAAAGRDVFLLFDTKSLSLTKGGIRRGVTKWRVRSEGCFSAAAEHYLLGDVDGDGLIDIGVVKDEIECLDKYDQAEDKDSKETRYKQYPADWYVFRGKAWQLDPTYFGKIPPSVTELPLIGSAADDVNDIPLGMWRNFDPTKRLELDGPPPAYVPPYWKNQIHEHAGAVTQTIDSSRRQTSGAGPTLTREIRTIRVGGITAHFGGDKPTEEFVNLTAC